ncbi:hypothetical protein BGZ61DRAFT_175796 [Ilyonectria robusta]|uniref:uncharacterized protein n=1 Tax=Ilyonectria robusta TaxID=1079257 RepID=UPI001E8EF389|nr:uncharacterized protein BGZ61DRAFT_175796 [Ilyonectria robusta]KAH8657279.1 hypothetical protein BGZ61DRAFT_175796 [Ilyonectria robusta]
MKPPNGHRPPGTRSGVEAAGDCNICRQTFLSPDDLYDHLDDCVLSVLIEEDPAEAINEKLLAEVMGGEFTNSSPELYQVEPPPFTGREDNLSQESRSLSCGVGFR